MKFMLMMNAPAAKTGGWGMEKWTHSEILAHVQFMKDLNAELQAAGELVDGQGLADPGQAKLVRATKSGGVDTDGPFAETKEFLAGFWIVDVEVRERAFEIAGRISLAPGPAGAPLYLGVEVREVMSAPA